MGVGIQENIIAVAARQRRLPESADEGTFKRFYLALILWDYLEERCASVEKLKQRWGVELAAVQQLRADVCARAAALGSLCETLARGARAVGLGGGTSEQAWTALHQILVRMVVELEETDDKVRAAGLLLVPMMTPWRARIIFAMGIHDLRSLAHADPAALNKLLSKRAKGSSWQAGVSKQLVDGAKQQLRYMHLSLVQRQL